MKVTTPENINEVESTITLNSKGKLPAMISQSIITLEEKVIDAKIIAQEKDPSNKLSILDKIIDQMGNPTLEPQPSIII